MIDIHAHILPGVDDGAETLTDSIEMVSELARHGVTAVIATPHYVDETAYDSSRVENERTLEKVQKALADEGIEMELYLGNEIYINENIEDFVQEGEVSTLAGSKYVLVELPMDGRYPNYGDILLGLMDEGYRVVLAHPERYVSIQERYGLAEQMYEAGILLQCNVGSLVGQYGKRAKKVVQRLIKERKVFAFGSDIHHCRGDEYWQEVWARLRKYYSEAELEEVLVKNPQKILQDK